uniref:Uncharacterized protein n=1 Tax=Sphaerodactylus townsendi TaxID=933632 RepID=A0ACB8FTY6_9SAUR
MNLSKSVGRSSFENPRESTLTELCLHLTTTTQSPAQSVFIPCQRPSDLTTWRQDDLGFQGDSAFGATVSGGSPDKMLPSWEYEQTAPDPCLPEEPFGFIPADLPRSWRKNYTPLEDEESLTSSEYLTPAHQEPPDLRWPPASRTRDRAHLNTSYCAEASYQPVHSQPERSTPEAGGQEQSVLWDLREKNWMLPTQPHHRSAAASPGVPPVLIKEEHKLRHTCPDAPKHSAIGESIGDSTSSVLDFLSMKPYDISLDISMLSSLGKVKKELDHDDNHLHLDETTKLLQDLHEAQTDRVGSRPSSNLSSLSNASERDQHHLGKPWVFFTVGPPEPP